MKVQALLLALTILLAGCGRSSTPEVAPEPADASVASDTAPVSAKAVAATAFAATPVGATPLTAQNYALAETQMIFEQYRQKIAAATGTNGVGVLQHNKEGADPKDRTVMRINFDTLYSFAVLDLTEPAFLTLPETNGRYQSAWIITEEHYNPFAINEPGVYELNSNNVGDRHAMVVIRTQVNTADSADIAAANALQEQLRLEQQQRGDYQASHRWNRDEVLKMRAEYVAVVKRENLSATELFGKKGDVSLRMHNAGTAYGWGGFTPDQAVYLNYLPESTGHHTLTLKDVPVKAFWSITVYDAKGFPQGKVFNINSQFAQANANGEVVVNFGGPKDLPNRIDIFDGWNFVLRMYQPTQTYFDGDWDQPELSVEG